MRFSFSSTVKMQEMQLASLFGELFQESSAFRRMFRQRCCRSERSWNTYRSRICVR